MTTTLHQLIVCHLRTQVVPESHNGFWVHILVCHRVFTSLYFRTWKCEELRNRRTSVQWCAAHTGQRNEKSEGGPGLLHRRSFHLRLWTHFLFGFCTALRIGFPPGLCSISRHGGLWLFLLDGCCPGQLGNKRSLGDQKEHEQHLEIQSNDSLENVFVSQSLGLYSDASMQYASVRISNFIPLFLLPNMCAPIT